MDSGRDKLGEWTTRKGDEGTGSDDDDADAESLSVTGSDIPDPPQSGKRSAAEDESGHPDVYATVRREKRLAMNRESARNRRKQKQNLIKSLERQVVELRALNQQYQISIKELSSKNQKLENELAMSRIAMAHLSKGSTTPSAPQQQQQQHPPHHQQFNHHQLQQLQSQHIPTPREQQPWIFQQQQQQPQHQLQTQQLQHQSQTQQQPQIQFDLAFLNQGSFSIPITSNESIANTSVAGYAENIFPTSLERVVGWGDDVNFSTNQPITSDRFKSVSAIPEANISGNSAIADTGDATSRLCEPHRDLLPMQLGAAAVNASMLTSTPMLTPTWDSSWRSLQPNAMQSIETDTSLRENLATSATTSQPEHSIPTSSNLANDDIQIFDRLDSAFSRPSIDLSVPEPSDMGGFVYQQWVLEEIVRRMNSDQEPQSTHIQLPFPQPTSTPQQFNQPQLQLLLLQQQQQQQIQQQQVIQGQQQEQVLHEQPPLPLQPGQRPGSADDISHKEDIR